MKTLKFFLTAFLLMLTFHFCDMSVFASNMDGAPVDSSKYYFDYDVATTPNFTPYILLGSGDGYRFLSKNASFSGNHPTAHEPVPFTYVRMAFLYGTDSNGNAITVNSKPAYRLYRYNSSGQLDYLRGFSYWWFFNGNPDAPSNYVGSYQFSNSYFMNKSDAGNLHWYLVGTNVPIFNDYWKMVDYLKNNNLDVSDVKNSELLGDAPVPAESLGYLTDVQYYVDSAAYLYDPENTPEYVKWGSTSTTGIDLTDPRYYVEFMCEDKSTFLRHNSKDSYVAESGMPFSNAITYTASRYEYFSQYIFPKGSDERALMSGRAGKTSLYGSASSLGTVAASARQYKFSAAAQYKRALANDSDSDKSLIYQFVDGITTFNFTPQQWLFNHYDQSGKALNWSYDLYARIVDTQAGVGGDWLKIDRHNSPWEMSNDDRFLNGGVTVSEGHKFVNYKPTDVFVKLPENTGDTIIDKSIETGYVLNGDFQPTYNNQTYNYYVNNTTNNNDNSTTNNYFQNPNTNVEDDHDSIIDAIDILKSLGALSSLFLLLFSPLLPAWAVGFVGVAVTCIIAMVVWRVIKGVLPW